MSKVDAGDVATAAAVEDEYTRLLILQAAQAQASTHVAAAGALGHPWVSTDLVDADGFDGIDVGQSDLGGSDFGEANVAAAREVLASIVQRSLGQFGAFIG